MPTYQAVCMECGAYHEYIRSVDHRNDSPDCCGVKTEKRLLSAPMMSADIQPWDAFESPATGRYITSKAQRREDMKRSGCREWEGLANEKQQAARQRQYAEEASDAALDKAARTAWAQLAPEKKAALAA